MAVTIQDLRARVETDLDDATLQRILDAGVKSVDRAAGAVTFESETKVAANSEMIATTRRILSIDTVQEFRRLRSPGVALSANDYRQVGANRVLRLGDGDNPARTWGQQVTIVYSPSVDQQLRDMVALDLAQTDLKFDAWSDQKSGDWSGKAEWKKTRAARLALVREGRSPIV